MLNNGEKFPALTVQAVDGGSINLPSDLTGSFGVVLIYRGAWCPVCNNQLAEFARAKQEFDRLGVKIVAFSVEDEATGTDLAFKHHLDYPVGHSVDADAVSAVLGAFVNDNPRYLQPTSFILSPDGIVLNAVYSTNAVGRISADDVKMLVEHIKSQAKAA